MKFSTRKIGLSIVFFYLGVGLLDLLPFPGYRSVLDALFEGFFAVVKEKSYTYPLEGLSNPAVGFHLLGTDVNGNDVLKLTLQGASTAIILSTGVALVSFPLGIFLGLSGGYLGGRVDDVIQWLYTTVASIPWILFVVTFLMVFGRGLIWVVIAIGLTSWVDLARYIRGETLRLREQAFIRAAKATGMSVPAILLREILPNTMPIIRINFALSSSSVILAETVLTFIGIGIEPGTSSWGGMISEAQRELMRDPVVWWNFFSATALGIFPLVLALNLLADEEEKKR
jgi:peptide/nickel transport system permease protein